MTESESNIQEILDNTFDSLVRPENEIHFICFTNTPKKSAMYPPKYLERLQKKYGIEFHIVDNLFRDKHILDQILDNYRPSLCFEG